MSAGQVNLEAEETGPPGLQLPLSAGRPFTFLDGVKVLDFCTSIAGPYAGMLLGDLGANVVKVERQGVGDDARAWGPPFLDGESLWFLSVNRNKRSLALDFTSDEGAEILRHLLGEADIVLVNYPPRVAQKLGLSPDQVKALKPDVIYVSITGFGLEGMRADWTCYDLIAEGYSGIMDVTGTPGSEPQKVGAPAADMLAGHDAAMAAIGALVGRGRTGEGAVIGVSLVESMTRFLSCRIVPYLGSGEVPARSGGKDSVIAVYQAFETADLPITLALGTDNLWARFWEVLGEPERALEPGTRTNADRRARRTEIVAAIQERLLSKPRQHWLHLFQVARIPAGPINRVDEVASDPELIRRSMFFRLEEPGRVVPQVGTGFTVNGVPNQPRRMPPRLGEHTAEILREWLGEKVGEVPAEAPAPSQQSSEPV